MKNWMKQRFGILDIHRMGIRATVIHSLGIRRIGKAATLHANMTMNTCTSLSQIETELEGERTSTLKIFETVGDDTRDERRVSDDRWHSSHTEPETTTTTTTTATTPTTTTTTRTTTNNNINRNILIELPVTGRDVDIIHLQKSKIADRLPTILGRLSKCT
jgi:hypothetical protein